MFFEDWNYPQIFWTGQSQSKAARQTGRRGDYVFHGGPRGDGTYGSYRLTGHTRGGWRPGLRSGASASPQPIYSWFNDGPAKAQAPPPPPAPAPAPPPAAPPPAPYKPTHINTSSSPPAVKAPVYNINNDPAYKALQAKLASMKSQYSGLQGQYSGLQGQFSGLKGQYAAMNNNLQIISGQLKTSQDKEKAYAKAEQDRIDQLAAQNAFGKTTNKQVGGVKTKKSLALQQGLTSRGTSGSFGRSGLRIKNLNI